MSRSIDSCIRCGVDISARDTRAKYCVPCAEAADKESRRAWSRRNPEKVKAAGKIQRERAMRERPDDVRARRLASYHRCKPRSKTVGICRACECEVPKVRGSHGYYCRSCSQKRLRQYQNEYHRIRRAKKLSASSLKVGQANIDSMLIKQKNRCAARECNTKLPPFHVDHYYPLAPRKGERKGTHEASNLQLLCPACNFRKSNRSPEAFARLRGWLF